MHEFAMHRRPLTRRLPALLLLALLGLMVGLAGCGGSGPPPPQPPTEVSPGGDWDDMTWDNALWG